MAQPPLKDEADPLRHSPARLVAGVAAKLQPAGVERTECQGDEEAHGLGDIAMARIRDSDPIPYFKGTQVPVRFEEPCSPR